MYANHQGMYLVIEPMQEETTIPLTVRDVSVTVNECYRLLNSVAGNLARAQHIADCNAMLRTEILQYAMRKSFRQ